MRLAALIGNYLILYKAKLARKRQDIKLTGDCMEHDFLPSTNFKLEKEKKKKIRRRNRKGGREEKREKKERRERRSGD